MKKSKTRCIGILTAGGDCPGLNAAIRGVAKAAINQYGMKVFGILDGYLGLIENRTMRLDDDAVNGLLTVGGTILGTSRIKPHKMSVGGKIRDMTDVAVENARAMELDALVCLGGGGTQKNAIRLMKAGLNVITLPKTIDNDVAGTDLTFGYDSARVIATEALDRLQTTATSHHRIIVCEIMGHNAGWLTLAAGIAGGADVILIPELPYDLKTVADFLHERRRNGKRFSIVAVSEGAVSKDEAKAALAAEQAAAKKHDSKKKDKKDKKKSKKDEDAEANAEVAGDGYAIRKIGDETLTYRVVQEPMASRIARRLQELTGIEARVTSLGHVQRGGVPSAFDRLLCTSLGTKAAQLLAEGTYGVMVGYRGGECVPVPLEEVAGVRASVPTDHPMIDTARLVGISLGT